MSDRDSKTKTGKEKKAENGKIDEEIEESFPASDPPAFMGGDVIGAPKRRETPQPPSDESKK